MGSFLRKLWAAPTKPDAIVFYNSGVKLLRKGSAVLDALDGLAHAGVDLVACGTCVRFYELEQELGAGRVSDMQDILGRILSSEKAITV